LETGPEVDSYLWRW